MENFAPVYGTGPLLGIAAGAIALLLFLIIRFNVHAFIALVLVSVVTALASGIRSTRWCPPFSTVSAGPSRTWPCSWASV